MKVKRYKRVKNYLTFYKNKFGFRPPFQVLIDGTFCQFALQNKVNISEQLPKYLSEEVKLVTTVCVVEETQRLSQDLYGAMLVVKQFPIHRCGHEKNPIAANKCLKEMICKDKNKDHYFLASQDPVLTKAIRKTSCPLIYLKGNAIVLDKPSDTIKGLVEKKEKKVNREMADQELEVLKQLKKIHDLDDSDAMKKPKKRKGPKEPNPLSRKKKQKKSKGDDSQSSPNKNVKNKNKKRSRVPKHIKRLFSKIESTIDQTS